MKSVVKKPKRVLPFILFTAALSVLAFVSNQNIYAQWYLSEFRHRNESNDLAGYADDFADFLNLAKEIETKT